MVEWSRATQRYLCRDCEIFETMVRGMEQSVQSGSIGRDFIVQMIPHHEAAIFMAQNLLQYTTCLPLQAIADRIIEEQTEGVRQMKNIQAACGTIRNKPQELAKWRQQMKQIEQTMFRQMREACVDNSIDVDFLRRMIPHHRGAVRMAETTLCYPICRELVPILRRIAATQKKGICQMEALLKNNG